MSAGYSTIWFADAISKKVDGQIITIDQDKNKIERAKRNFEDAGVSDLIEIRNGDALEVVADINNLPNSAESFDFVFIDADKVNHKNYLERALKLTGSGAVIVADNIVRGGAVIDAERQENSVKGVRAMMAYAATLDGLDMTALQTVGTKGYDGMAIFRVR